MTKHFSTLPAKAPICGYTLTPAESGHLNSYTFLPDPDVNGVTCPECQAIIEENLESLRAKFSHDWMFGNIGTDKPTVPQVVEGEVRSAAPTPGQANMPGFVCKLDEDCEACQ